MNHLKIEYGYFTNDGTFIIPVCMREAGSFQNIAGQLVSIIPGPCCLSLSTNLKNAKYIVTVDGYGRIVIGAALIRQSGFLLTEPYLACLVNDDMITIKPINFLETLLKKIRPVQTGIALTLYF